MIELGGAISEMSLKKKKNHNLNSSSTTDCNHVILLIHYLLFRFNGEVCFVRPSAQKCQFQLA